LLQVLDDGHITDAQGRRVSFKNTVIIMTSNAGARSIIEPKKLGFVSSEDSDRDYEHMKKMVMEEVKQIFRPEFLNRLDDIIVFHPLDKDEVKQITRLLLNETIKRVKDNMNITLVASDEVVFHISEAGFDTTYGARPLRRAIQTMIEDELAETILEQKFENGDEVHASLDDGKIVFKVLTTNSTDK
jgi:ATP-dependent Clp protease ATP-binding subunit ClpC